MARLIIIALAALLAGCGVETATTAAVAAKAQADANRQATQIQEEVRNNLNAAAQLEQQRLDESRAAQN